MSRLRTPFTAPGTVTWSCGTKHPAPSVGGILRIPSTLAALPSRQHSGPPPPRSSVTLYLSNDFPSKLAVITEIWHTHVSSANSWYKLAVLYQIWPLIVPVLTLPQEAILRKSSLPRAYYGSMLVNDRFPEIFCPKGDCPTLLILISSEERPTPSGAFTPLEHQVVSYGAYLMTLYVLSTYGHLRWSSTIYSDSIDKSSARSKDQALLLMGMLRALWDHNRTINCGSICLSPHWSGPLSLH